MAQYTERPCVGGELPSQVPLPPPACPKQCGCFLVNDIECPSILHYCIGFSGEDDRLLGDRVHDGDRSTKGELNSISITKGSNPSWISIEGIILIVEIESTAHSFQ